MVMCRGRKKERREGHREGKKNKVLISPLVALLARPVSPLAQALHPSHLLPGLPFLPSRPLPQTPCFAFLTPQLSTAPDYLFTHMLSGGLGAALHCSLPCRGTALGGSPAPQAACHGTHSTVGGGWADFAPCDQLAKESPSISQKEEKTKRPEKNLNALHPPDRKSVV